MVKLGDMILKGALGWKCTSAYKYVPAGEPNQCVYMALFFSLAEHVGLTTVKQYFSRACIPV